MPKDAPSLIRLKEYSPPDFRIDTVNLAFDLREDFTLVRSCLGIEATTPTEPRPLVLNGQALELVSIALDGRALDAREYRVDEDALTVPRVPARFKLEIETRIKPQENTALEGLYPSGSNFCTQCEAEGFRKITYFLDRPDVMAHYTTKISADRERYPVLLSNGNRVDCGELPGNRHWVRWADPYRKPSYLFALVSGDLVHSEDDYTTRSGREVRLRIYVEKRNHDKCQHAMDSLKKAMAWDEAVFGLEYDLDIYMIVAVDDFNMGAMENKGLNLFNSKYVLADPATATDADFENIEGVIGHEYFHNWTGNRVTCRDWFQLSLKEGLTVFRDQEFSADMTSRAVKRIDDVRSLRTRQFLEDSGPMAHPVRPESYIEINNFYTATVYQKGAEVIRMIHTLLGREGFRKGLDLYFKRHDGQAVTSDDFVQAMQDANDYDLGQFKRWYSQAGTPELTVRDHYDPETQVYTLTVRQSCPPTPGQAHKEPFHLPLAVGLLGPDGHDMPLRLEGEQAPASETTRILNLRAEEATFRFSGIAHKPVPSLLRGFSAPVKLDAGYSERDLAFLMAHDSDPFNRWEAGQQLATQVLLDLVAAHQQGRTPTLNEPFMDAFAKTLQDPHADPALLAQALTLPSETYVAEFMDEIDVEGIHRARLFLRKRLAATLKDLFLGIYRDNRMAGAYRFEPSAVGQRSLTNTCLGYLMELEKPEIRDLCMAQFRKSNNMTDVMAALHTLTNTDCPERTEALAEFYEKWHEDPLVIDKWFALQATSRLPRTLDEVKALMKHAAFTLKNPNRVRSVIGAFCSGNPIRFHEATGAGYAFLTEQVLRLNALNPQIAARLLGALTQWRRYDRARQELMKAALEQIVQVPDLSKDVYEIATKSLA